MNKLKLWLLELKWYWKLALMFVIIYPATKDNIFQRSLHSRSRNSSEIVFRCPVCGNELVNDMAYTVQFGGIQEMSLKGLNPHNFPLGVISSGQCYECSLKMLKRRL